MTIPASLIVNVSPNVLPAGGSSLDLNGLMLTTSTRVPMGSVVSLSSTSSVEEYFGGSSAEAALAQIYFLGFEGSNVKPGALLFAQYNQVPVAAYLRGGNISQMTLADLQAITGTLSIIVDGFTHSAAALNLSASTTFSSAASIIQTALNGSLPTLALVTGSIAGDVLTVTGVTTGSLAPGQALSGAGVTAGTYIVEQLTGTEGQDGTYTVSVSQTAAATSITATASNVVVTYDSVSGAFVITSGIVGPSSTVSFATGTTAVPLLLTSATAATLSQGADVAVPGEFMNGVKRTTQNWATFMTTFDPDNGSGNDEKMKFAAWTSAQNKRYGYACWDLDPNVEATSPATNTVGYKCKTLEYDGVIALVASDADGRNPADISAFACGYPASLDFAQTKGRATLMFRRSGGFGPTITDEQDYINAIANGYSGYCAFATANDDFNFMADGQISGVFLWADSYFNQIWLNNSLQLALMVFLSNSRSLPYNTEGYSSIKQAMQDVIQQALSFGAIRPGVDLSASQITAVNAAAAGVDIATTLQNVGYYTLIIPATPEQRANRMSPSITFFYVDGQSIQQIDMASVAVQ